MQLERKQSNRAIIKKVENRDSEGARIMAIERWRRFHQLGLIVLMFIYQD